MLFLTPTIVPTTLEQKRGYSLNDRSAEHRIAVLGELIADPDKVLDGKGKFSVALAHDQNGDTYQDVTVISNSTFRKDGALWLSDGGLALNITAMRANLVEELRLLREAQEL